MLIGLKKRNEIAQRVNRSPCKPDDLSSIPRTHVKAGDEKSIPQTLSTVERMQDTHQREVGHATCDNIYDSLLK